MITGINRNLFVPKTGGTMTGNLRIDGNAPSVTLHSATGNENATMTYDGNTNDLVLGSTDGVARADCGFAGPFINVSQFANLTAFNHTVPADGDLWFDGTNLKFRIGGVTKTITWS